MVESQLGGERFMKEVGETGLSNCNDHSTTFQFHPFIHLNYLFIYSLTKFIKQYLLRVFLCTAIKFQYERRPESWSSWYGVGIIAWR